MTPTAFVSDLTSKRRVVRLTSLTTAAAAAAACLIGLITFPLVASVDGPLILVAIMATAAPVAFPICLVLIRTILRLEEQRGDIHAREEQMAMAQRIAKLGYWHFDVETAQFTLSDNVHDLLGDHGRTEHDSTNSLRDGWGPCSKARPTASSSSTGSGSPT